MTSQDKFNLIIGAIILIIAIAIIVFNIVVTINCWNTPLAERTGWCALQHTSN